MPITRDDLERVLLLARLSLPADEEARLVQELGEVLAYVEKLDRLATDDVPPMTHVVDIGASLRDDVVSNRPDTDALMANAPAREDGFFRVPKIIE
ncbi:MAG TPA: Asp-tRNA(Asn)/Glu-tRNA(Gln) amidotransferase subunit GatC [Candidatus Eisenbacteria bacterium]|nr:Asp-tRNA(Asn)/Glu-tRNA(Gln) amidotransferase subunit GatC [Candidatus Eisenbacteria bacterium]